MDQKTGIGADVKFGAEGHTRAQLATQLKVKHTYRLECYDKYGTFKWEAVAENLVTNEGLDDILDKYYKGSTYTATHYVGLTGSTPSPAAGDTMSSHGGWSEFTTYTASSPNVRPTLTLGTVSGQAVDNSASKASYTIDVASPDSQDIGGAFLSTDNTIGGTAGLLISVAAFDLGDKTLNGGDTLNVTVTATAASA